MADEIHLSDIGTVFEVTIEDASVAVDVSSATTKQLIFVAPDGTKDTQTASFKTDGTDGIIQYTTLAGDLDQIGEWQLQANVVLTSGTWRSDIGRFIVHANL